MADPASLAALGLAPGALAPAVSGQPGAAALRAAYPIVAGAADLAVQGWGAVDARVRALAAQGGTAWRVGPWYFRHPVSDGDLAFVAAVAGYLEAGGDLGAGITTAPGAPPSPLAAATRMTVVASPTPTVADGWALDAVTMAARPQYTGLSVVQVAAQSPQSADWYRAANAVSLAYLAQRAPEEIGAMIGFFGLDLDEAAADLAAAAEQKAKEEAAKALQAGGKAAAEAIGGGSASKPSGRSGAWSGTAIERQIAAELEAAIRMAHDGVDHDRALRTLWPATERVLAATGRPLWDASGYGVEWFWWPIGYEPRQSLNQVQTQMRKVHERWARSGDPVVMQPLLREAFDAALERSGGNVDAARKATEIYLASIGPLSVLDGASPPPDDLVVPGTPGTGTRPITSTADIAARARELELQRQGGGGSAAWWILGGTVLVLAVGGGVYYFTRRRRR